MSISGFIGAAPLIANRELEKPAASFNFPLKIFERPGIINPYFNIALDSIAAIRLEYIFSYILGTEIKRCGCTSFA